MAKAKAFKREQEKKECQYCGKEIAKSGLANHERRCAMNPENADKDASELMEDEELEEGAEEEETEDDETEDESSESEDTEADQDDEDEEDEDAVEADNPNVVTAIGLHNHKFFQFDGYVVIERGKEVKLSKENFKILAQQGHVVLK